MKNFTFTAFGQKAYFSHNDSLLISNQLSGISAKISKILVENVDKVVTFEEITSITHGQKPDYFIQRSIDVHLCKVRKFFEANGYAFERIRQTGIKITANVDK